MSASTQPQLDRQAAFWDARAADYPDPCAAGQRALLRHRLSHLPASARAAPGLRLLDVGAGAGAIALDAAEHGAIVTALDISSAMLQRLAATAAARSLSIATRRADWRDLDVAAAGWQHAFDLVFAQMVPSLRDAADFARLEACSRGWCVFIGWGRERHDAWLEAAFRAHGLPWEVPAGVPLAARQLRSLGRSLSPVYWREQWPRSRSAAAALRDAADHLRVRGVAPDPSRLRDELGRLFGAAEPIVDGCEVEVGLLAWQPPGGGDDTAR